MKKFLLIALLCVSGNAGAEKFAAFGDGNKLLEWCNAGAHSEARNWCLGYIASVRDTHNSMEDRGWISKQMCVPVEAAAGQLVRVVLNYLEGWPAELHIAASSLVLNALGQAFPCTERPA